MKQVAANYTFNTGAKTITLGDFSVGNPLVLERLFMITDVTTNEILYNFGSPVNAVGAVTATITGGNVITLSALPGDVANGDSLQIIYEADADDVIREPMQTVLMDPSGTQANVTSVALGVAGIDVIQAGYRYIESAGNTTTAQLAPGGKFVGAIESGYNQQSVSILVNCDQSGTLVINQYIDALGTYQVATDSFNIAAGADFARSFVINGNYLNLTFTNTGLNSTTTLNIDTAYGPFPPSTTLMNTPMALNEVNGVNFALGKAQSAGSLPVVVASDQSSVPVTIQPSSSGNPVNIDQVAGQGVTTTGEGVTLHSLADEYGVPLNTISGALQITPLGVDTVPFPNTQVGQRASLVAGSYWEQKWTVGSALLRQASAVWDVANYSFVSIEVSFYGATVTFQQSNDGATWYNWYGQLDSTASGAATNTAAAVGMYSGPLRARYFRILGGATLTSGICEFYASPRVGQLQQAYIAGSATLTINTPAVIANAAAADAATNGTNQLYVQQGVYNGASVDRVRGNVTASLIAAGTTSSQSPAAVTTYNARQLLLLVNVSAVSSGTLTVVINLITTNYTYPVLTSASLGSIALTAMVVGPGLPVTANLSANSPLSRTFNVVTTVTGTITYGVDYALTV